MTGSESAPAIMPSSRGLSGSRNSSYSEANMISKELENLVRTGALKRQAIEQKEFDGLLDSGQKPHADTAHPNLSDESRFSLAYEAAHAFSRAALCWHGYRTEKRFLVFQTLPHTAGIKPEIWRVLAKCHELR